MYKVLTFTKEKPPGGAVKGIYTDAEWDATMVDVKSTKKGLALVCFSSSVCRPCKTVAPAFEALSLKYGDVRFLKLDCADVKKAAKEHKVLSVPFFKLFKGGEPIGDVTGARPDEIEQLLVKSGAVERAVEAPQAAGGSVEAKKSK